MKMVADTKEIDAKLGPEPLDEDFTLQYFSEGLAKRTAPVKAFILEQKFIAGVGNMYADEALFAAGIDPRRPADSLKKTEIKRLYTAIREVIAAGIKYGGASVVTYYHPDGSVGTAHEHFNVAQTRKRNARSAGGRWSGLWCGGGGLIVCRDARNNEYQ